jgi:hypothetical protein
MNRKTTLILMIAVFLASCNSNKNDLEESNLKGEIWKVKETSYEGEEKFGKYQIGDKNYWGHQFYVFNKDGNLTELQRLDRKGKTERISKYNYDKDGNCMEITTYEDDEVVQKQVNRIEKGKLVEVQVFDKDGELSDKYQYNYSGDDISSGKVFNSNGKLNITFKNGYSSGFLNTQIVKDSLDEIKSILTYERNNEGDIINQKIEYPKDTSENVYTFSYDYDDKGNWLKQYQFDKEGKIEDIIVRNIVYYNESKKAKNEKDFIGMWFVIDDNDWIEFRSDKKYDSGYKDRIKETGVWEIDSEQQILTFRADDPDDSRKYKYDFEGYQMILFTIQGEEKLRLEKR